MTPTTYHRHRRYPLARLLLALALLLVTLATAFAYLGQEGMAREVSHSYAKASPDEGNLILVNRWRALPKHYRPELVTLANGQAVDQSVVEALDQLLADAEAEDMVIEVLSGHRSREEQARVMKDKIRQLRREGYSAQEAKQEASKWVAAPGHSEHETGLAVDLTGSSYDVFDWLATNAHRYGFIRRYPEDKTDITGVSGEVWHFRYVGIEDATAIYEADQVLEEYLGFYH